MKEIMDVVGELVERLLPVPELDGIEEENGEIEAIKSFSDPRLEWFHSRPSDPSRATNGLPEQLPPRIDAADRHIYDTSKPTDFPPAGSPFRQSLLDGNRGGTGFDAARS